MQRTRTIVTRTQMQALEKPRLPVRPESMIKKTRPVTVNFISAGNNVLYRFVKILGGSRDVGVVREQEHLSHNGHGLQ